MAAFFVILQNFGQTCVQEEDREVPGEDYTWSGLGSDYEEDQSGARVAKYTAPVHCSGRIGKCTNCNVAILGGNLRDLWVGQQVATFFQNVVSINITWSIDKSILQTCQALPVS